MNTNDGGGSGSEEQGHSFHLPTLTDNDFNWGYSQPALNLDASWIQPKTSCIISLSLRQWIKKALDSVGGGRDASHAIHSPEYRTACLKIAKCLSSQIHEAEELAEKGIFDKLSQLPANKDWADCVYVRVETLNEQASALNQPRDFWEEGLSQVEGLQAEDILAGGVEESEGSINAQVESFFGSFETNHHQQTARLEAFDDDVHALNDHLPDELFNGDFADPSTVNQNESSAFQDEMEATADAGLKATDDDMLPRNLTLDDRIAKTNAGAAAAFQDNFERVNSHQEMETSADALQASWGEVDGAFGYRLDQSKNQQIDALFEALQGDEIQEAASSNPADDFSRIQNEDNHSLEGRTSPVLVTINPTVQDNNSYLRVDSAGFEPPAARLHSHGQYANRQDSAAKRIYLLGMVLYELFSGGQMPHPRLYEVASTVGAFVSLPKLSLGDLKDDEDNSLQNAPKRRQSLSSSSRDVSICNISCNHLKMLAIPHQLYQVSQVTAFLYLAVIVSCFLYHIFTNSFTNVSQINPS